MVLGLRPTPLNGESRTENLGLSCSIYILHPLRKSFPFLIDTFPLIFGQVDFRPESTILFPSEQVVAAHLRGEMRGVALGELEARALQPGSAGVSPARSRRDACAPRVALLHWPSRLVEPEFVAAKFRPRRRTPLKPIKGEILQRERKSGLCRSVHCRNISAPTPEDSFPSTPFHHWIG